MKKDLTGLKFGRLTVIKLEGQNKYKRLMWLCKCDCGNTHIVSSNLLLMGVTRSCGCLNDENRKSGNNRRTHGMWGTRLYRIWKCMKNRCLNKNTNDYKKWYGSKGVTVCEEWLNFEPFCKWALAHGYKDDLSIDRINPYGNYEPSNCRWADAKTQANNKRKRVV